MSALVAVRNAGKRAITGSGGGGGGKGEDKAEGTAAIETGTGTVGSMAEMSA